MAAAYDDYDDDETEPTGRQQATVDPAELRVLRKKAKDYDEVSPKLSKYERENVLLSTLVDNPAMRLNATQRRAVLNTHEGDWTPDALAKTVEDMGWYKAPAADAATEAALDADERVRAAAAGATPSGARPDIANELHSGLSEDEFWAKAQSLGVTVQ